MLFDKEALLSDAQAITSTANSTNVYDARSSVADIGRGKEVWFEMVVNEAFTASGSATLTVTIETDDNSSFSSATTIATSPAIGKATLVVGYVYRLSIPAGGERYYRAVYTVATGPMTAGKVTAQFGPRQASDTDKFFPRAAYPVV